MHGAGIASPSSDAADAPMLPVFNRAPAAPFLTRSEPALPTAAAQPDVLRVLADAFDKAATTQPTKEAAAHAIANALLIAGFTILSRQATIDLRAAVLNIQHEHMTLLEKATP